MTIHDYIVKVIRDFEKAEGNEVTGIRKIDFDIGVTPTNAGTLKVDNYAANRIRFTLEVKRG